MKSVNPVVFYEPGFSLPELPGYAAQGHRVKLIAVIEETHSNLDWAKAYAEQGRDDLRIYGILASNRGSGPGDCHELHYLQMALEKIGKAWVLRFGQGAIENHRSSHVVAAAFLKTFMKSQWAKTVYTRTGDLPTHVKALAEQIERLAPGVERESSPTNVEYPWSDSRSITVPASHAFLARWSFGKEVLPALNALLVQAADEASK